MTSIYTLGSCIAFMICGANSDLFGRRTFILVGNVAIIVGSIVGGTSHSIGQTIAASAILGFGGGNCQIASFALPELLPNRWKHIGVVIADLGITFDVVIGPVASRIALDSGAVEHTDPSAVSNTDGSLVEMGLLGHDLRTRYLIHNSCVLWSV